VAQLLDVVAPALPVAQAIGRLGNWFNQELFGRPTDLPWGLEIDPAHRPAGYLNVATFHPTFLYEALWNLALAGGLVLWERHHPNSRPGRLFAYYVAGYAVGRAWVEALRIDPAARLFGVRWNIWMSFIAFVGAVGWLVFDSWRARQEAGREPGEAVAATEEVDAGEASTDMGDVATADEPGTGAAEESAAAGADTSGERPAPGEASEGEPTAGDRTDTTGAPGPEDQPEEAEVGADEAAATETAADAAADAAEKPDVAESAAGVETGERSDTTEKADTIEKADAVDSADTTEEADAVEGAADASDAADEPSGPAANDREADGATVAERDAGEPTDTEASHRANPEPAPGAPTEAAGEEAAT
jgi:hypothetical protein